MSPVVWALVGLFTAISIAAGALATWLVGPRRRWAPILPFVAAFGALYLLGHGGVVVGPQVPVLGFELSLPFEIGVALVAALVAAFAQRAAWWVSRGRTPPSR